MNQRTPRLYWNDEQVAYTAQICLWADHRQLARRIIAVNLVLLGAIAAAALILVGAALLTGMLLAAGNAPAASTAAVIAAGGGMVGLGWMMGRYGWK